MKTKNLFILMAASVCMLVISTGFTNAQLQSEERQVPDFSGFNFAVAGEVYLVQGPVQKLVVEGTERVLDDLITEVKGGKLTIRMPNRWNFRRSDELKVYITMPEINSISLSGSGRIFAESPIRAGKLSISVSGSGRMEIENLSANELQTAISGSGRINLGGSEGVKRSKIAISGSGRCEFSSLSAEIVEATISGSGSCRVNAVSDLNVRISGSGNLSYTGNPLIDARISGSGKIINNN